MISVRPTRDFVIRHMFLSAPRLIRKPDRTSVRSCFYLSDTAWNWLKENCPGGFYITENGDLEFPEEKDAFMFKMTWM